MQRFQQAFVICPLGGENTATRSRSDALVENIIQPILSNRHRCEVGRADYFRDEKAFLDGIHRHIISADLIVVDLTDLNPNVLYEMGYASAFGLPVIIFIDDFSKLPSDLKHFLAIEYNEKVFADSTQLARKRADFEVAVRGAAEFAESALAADLTKKITQRLDLTSIEEVHTGSRDHYELAAKLVLGGPSTICLLQRSSTVILGPEANWDREGEFYEALWSAVERGASLRHVVTLDGISRHLHRTQSEFPEVEAAVKRLGRIGRAVAIPIGDGSHGTVIKTFPTEAQHVDIKPDRQARALFADFGSRVEAIVVMDFGGQQMSLRMVGPKAREMYVMASEFYNSCDTLRVADLERLLSPEGIQVDLKELRKQP